jgi:hypothetical protein
MVTKTARTLKLQLGALAQLHARDNTQAGSGKYMYLFNVKGATNISHKDRLILSVREQQLHGI